MHRTVSVSRLVVLAGAAAGAVHLSACHKEQASEQWTAAPRALVPTAPWNPRVRPVSEMLETAARLAPASAVLVSEARLSAEGGGIEPVAPLIGDAVPGELLPVRYSLSGASAADVFRELITGLLGRPLVLDPSVAQSPVTLDIDAEMTRTEILDLVGGLCMLYGLQMEDREGVLFIRKSDDMARSDSAPIMQARAAFESDMPAIRIRKTRHVPAEALKTFVEPLMSKGAKVLTVGRALVLVDTVRQLNKVSRLLSALDAAPFEGSEIWIYRIGHRTPEEALKIVQALGDGTKISGGADPLVAFVPLPGTDRLAVISRDPSVRPLVHAFMQQADQPPGRAQRARYIYRVQHMDTQALSGLLTKFFADRMEREAVAAPPAGGGAAADDSRMRITAEINERMLLVQATPEDYADLLATLRAVDRPRMQVHITSVFAEVQLVDRLEYGVEYFLRLFDEDGIGIAEAIGTPGGPLDPFGSIFFTGGDGLAIVRALKRVTDVNILQTPSITVENFATATLNVGGEQPTAASSSDTEAQQGGSTLARTDIEYKNTGIRLLITPTISESGYVSMEIEQENRVLDTSSQNQTTAGQTTPAFVTRTIQTTVTVPHGKTVLIGGIRQQIDSKSRNKIPILGELPGVGAAFGSGVFDNQRIELLLAITPTIIAEPEDAMGLTSEFLVSAHGVRNTLYSFLEDVPAGMLAPPAAFVGPPLPEADPAPDADDPVEPGAEDPVHDLPPFIREMLEQEGGEG